MLAIYLALVFIASVILVVINESGKRPVAICLLSALVLSSFSLVISFDGLDSSDRLVYDLHYMVYYSKFVDNPIAIFDESFQQLGWAIINVAFRIITSDIAWLFYFVSVLYVFSSLVLLNSFCKRETFFIAALLFFLTMGPLYSMFQVRQFLAIAICNLGTSFLIKGYRKTGLLFAILSVAIHSSAIVYVAALAGGWLLKDRTLLVKILSIAAIAFLPLATVLLPLIEAYLPYLYRGMQGSVNASSQGLLVAAKGAPFAIIYLMLFTDNAKKNLSPFAHATLLIMAAVSFGVFLLATKMYWAWRFAFYFLVPLVAYCANRMRYGYGRIDFLMGWIAASMFVALAMREIVIVVA